jgi:hypothetical protein
MMVHKWRKHFQEARGRLEEVHIFLEEDIHNVTLQEKAMKVEMDVCRGEDYIVRGAQVCSCLSWIQDGDEGSKFFFYFLKRKVVADKVLGCHKDDESFTEDPSKV